MPDLGNFLGEFTSEIKKAKGNFIYRWVSGGPKNYSYELDTGYTHAVIKGISLGHTTAATLNFESIRNLVHSEKKTPIVVDQLKFSRNTANWKVRTSIIQKKYGFVYDKRVIQKDMSSLPYGY